MSTEVITKDGLRYMPQPPVDFSALPSKLIRFFFKKFPLIDWNFKIRLILMFNRQLLEYKKDVAYASTCQTFRKINVKIEKNNNEIKIKK